MVNHAAPLFALSDPTRRAIVERLRSEPASVAEIAHGLPVSRPAVSQHLAVLKQCGLVTDRRLGRRHVYSLEPEGLEPLRLYVEGLWSDVLGAYRRAAETEAAETEAAVGAASDEEER